MYVHFEIMLKNTFNSVIKLLVLKANFLQEFCIKADLILTQIKGK